MIVQKIAQNSLQTDDQSSNQN